MRGLIRGLLFAIELVAAVGFVVACLKAEHVAAVSCFAVAMSADTARRVDALEEAFGDERDKRG